MLIRANGVEMLLFLLLYVKTDSTCPAGSQIAFNGMGVRLLWLNNWELFRWLAYRDGLFNRDCSIVRGCDADGAPIHDDEPVLSKS